MEGWVEEKTVVENGQQATGINHFHPEKIVLHSLFKGSRENP